MMNESGGCKIVAIGEGDACAGKGFVAASLACGMAMHGLSVVLLDADTEGGNVQTLFGIHSPEKVLDCFHWEGAGKPSDYLLPTSVKRLSLLCGSPGFFEIAVSDPAEKQKFLEGIRSIEADYALINVGSGGTADTVDFVNLADTGIIATGPSQEALRSAFVFLRTVVQRKLLHLIENGSSLRVEIASAIDERRESGNIGAMLSLIREKDEGMYDNAVKVLRESRYRLLLQGEHEIDGEQIGKAFSAAARQYFKIRLPYLGCIPCENGVEVTPGQENPTFYAERVKKPGSIDHILRKIMEREPSRAPGIAPANKGETKSKVSGKAGSPRQYQLGINEEVDLGGIKLHVQTEDLGISQGKILTIVFRGGEVLYSKTSSYQTLTKDKPDVAVREKVSLQHREIIEQIRNGMLSDMIPTEREVKK